tara:strand:- start:73 stop:492 length:420 start_codon:yes stop_codon:yes gene_type:complete
MSWKNIIKEITENTVIEEKEEIVSLFERFHKVGLEVSGNDDEGYDVNSRKNSIDSDKKIQGLLELYEEEFTNHLISEFKGSGEVGYHIETILDSNGHGINFEMDFGHFGDHYIWIRGIKKDMLGQKLIDFFNKLAAVLE